MGKYAMKIPRQIENAFSFNFLGPRFDSISPWQSRKQEIYENVNKKIHALSKE